ncbi:PIR Superfamily Protein [Plasmodium ovale wallikeri]|uniref:PIR Superfamily Protein n=1 Tax=Plasmodium ovale wallikeri TaxID=864142 RepID=A0A1A9AEK6_PLAOA|nr:PIR Superfamily Protein [Plasmodium ovale wallikeri]SBT56826.1 PIR Superfamily Protein [Plasmodium ovale wallikeri]
MTGTGKKLEKGDYYDSFFKLRGTFNNIRENEYTQFLYNKDQVLRNIALNLIENYEAQYKLCKTSNENKECCNYLNKWLNEKKAIYTSNTKCKSHNDLWEHYIEKLWKEMQQDVQEKERCQRNTSGPQYFPSQWIIPSCDNDNPVEILSSCPEVPRYKDPVCPSTNTSTYSSCKSVLITTYVVFGFLLFSMYLLRFSSVAMKLNNLIRGGGKNERNTDKDTNESFRYHENNNMETLDSRFNVIYNSFQNS